MFRQIHVSRATIVLILAALSLIPRALAARDLPWARVLDLAPDPSVVKDAETRAAIQAIGLPWRVVDIASGVELLLIPPGEYRRGAAADDPYDRPNERPQHSVTISRPFYLGRYEVTNTQMKRYRQDFRSGDLFRDESISLDGDSDPAVGLNWFEASSFARYFDLRLPTEAEWEYAARAGVKTRYPWGNEPERGAGWGNVFNASMGDRLGMDWQPFPFEDGFDGTAPVGSFRANDWGLHDMFGNAWEFVADAYNERVYETMTEGALDPFHGRGDLKILRGGGWGNAPRGSGIPYRFGMPPDARHQGNGFRVARSVDPQPRAEPRLDAWPSFECLTVPADQHQLFETMEPDFSWSPDGRSIVFGRGVGDRSQLHALDLESLSVTCLTRGDYRDIRPAWSPGGDSIAFASNRSGRQQIHQLDRKSGEVSVMMPDPLPQTYPTYSPRGDQLAYVRLEDDPDQRIRTLRLVNVDGTGDRELFTSSFGLNHHAWAPDGREIYFYSIEPSGFNDVFVVRVDDGSVRKLTDNSVTDSYSMVRSSEERVVSFSQGLGRSKATRWFNYEMFDHDEVTGKRRRLTWAWSPDDRQQYSPDGRYLVFASSRTGYLELYRMQADGSNLRQLTRQPWAELAGWFRQGRAIEATEAFAAAREREPELRMFNDRAPETLVEILVARSDLEAAEALAEMYVATYPDSARALRTRAFVRLKRGDRRADDDYRAAIVKEPNEMNTFVQLGPDRFLELVSGIPDFWLDHVSGMNALAYRLIDLGQPRHAITLFQHILAASPENWAVLDSLAEAFMLYGDYENAVRYYRESLRLHPDNGNATFHLWRIEGLAAAPSARKQR